MPGSATRTASPDAEFVRRFARTERALHWTHATAFFGLLGSGLVLYLPSLSEVAPRGVVKTVHLAIAVAWMVVVTLIVALGDHAALRRTLREIDRFDADDGAWLRGRPAPQGRFNAGQKVHAILQGAFAVLFVVSGALLWLGERNTRLRLSGTIALHDTLMYVAAALVAGHLVLALAWPSTRHALRGMTRGTVREDWARAHHAKWMTRADADRDVG